MNDQSRRNFLKNSSLASLAVVSTGATMSPDKEPDFIIKKILKQNATILFQGDSITDAHRRKDQYYANNGLGMGCGYVNIIMSKLLADYAQKNLKIYNRGISGHKVFQLANRWDDDCLNLKPDVISNMIGVNDFWHTLTHGYKGTVETYSGDYRKLLDRTLKALPDVSLILMEPFVIIGGTAIVEKDWMPAFKAYQQAAANVAKEYKAAFIPLQSKFEEISVKTKGTYWAPDGVHPSPGGNHQMATWWMESFKSIFE